MLLPWFSKKYTIKDLKPNKVSSQLGETQQINKSNMDIVHKTESEQL